MLLLASIGPACALHRPGDAGDDGIAVTPWARYESLQLQSSSDVFITSGGAPGSASTIDLKDDLGVDGASAASAGVDLTWGDQRVRVGYTSAPFDGKATLANPVIFNGVTFPAGAQTKSNLDLTFATLGYDSRIWHDDDSALRIGGEVVAWSFDMSVQAAGAGLSASRSFTHVLPAVTACYEQQFATDWRFSTDLTAGYLGSDRSVVEIQAGVGTLLWKGLHLDVGYRYQDLTFHETTNQGDLAASGPFVAAWMVF